MSTFSGKLLRIDLTEKKSSIEEIPERHLRDFISARGLGAKYLYDELRPGTEPLSPGNKLIFSIGVLGATGLQGFSKWAVTTRSPLTDTIFRAVTGGNFGAWMKHAGYDLIIIEGKGEKFLRVHLDTEGVHFLEAEDLVGLDYRTVQGKIKDLHGSHTESACIGPAGEKLVRYAVISSGERTASRGGVGTVMGAKNLKAISINVPIQKPAPHDPRRFAGLLTKQIDILKRHPRKKNMSTVGTPYITTVTDGLGILPVKNFQEGSIRTIKDIDGENFFALKRARAGCYVCMTRCGGMRDVTLGPLSGSRIDGPEYETIYAFGPLLGLTDKAFIINANALCDYYGLDTISTGVSLAYACELFEKGLISASDTKGLELRWGNREALFSLIEKIGKKEGFGEVLGEGVKRAAQCLGGDTDFHAMHIKGLEMAGYDPRGVKAYGLSMATSNIGGSHMYGRPREELSGMVDPYEETGKGEVVARVQKEQALEDSLIACTFGNTGLDLQFYSEALVAATGIDAFGSPENLLAIGERIVCIERCFNVGNGFSRKDDCLPRRMQFDPLNNAGPATGQVVNRLDGLLDEYYEALGYSKEGVPTLQKLQELKIDFSPKETTLPKPSSKDP